MEPSVNTSTSNANPPVLQTDLTQALLQASSLAYTDLANKNNPSYIPPSIPYAGGNFNFSARFTGFDDVAFGLGEEERYGLIYEFSGQPDTYLVAFRGTDSPYDMLLDLESATTEHFKPFVKSAGFPAHVHVGSGFNKIYATKNHSMATAMQNQIFNYFKGLATPPAEIIITGHSLGGALALLFALDVAVSLPEVAVSCMTFASPRVGDKHWQAAYNHTYNLEAKTIRVRNSYDLVPKVPPEKFPFDFKDVGQVFPVAYSPLHQSDFNSSTVLSWHALTNYTYVVNRATPNKPQVWTGEFPDQAISGWQMESYNPFTHSSAIESASSRAQVEQIVAQQKSSS